MGSLLLWGWSDRSDGFSAPMGMEQQKFNTVENDGFSAPMVMERQKRWVLCSYGDRATEVLRIQER